MHLFNMGNGLVASRNSVSITVRNNCPEATRACEAVRLSSLNNNTE